MTNNKNPGCEHCGEPILEGETGAAIPNMHRECSARVLIGSLAHALRICSCYVPGSTLNDPPHVSKRKAAQAALAVYRMAAEFYPPEFSAPEPPCPKPQ